MADGGESIGRDVFVLGAGFSRAISGAMPLTDELGNATLARLDLTDRRRAPVRSFARGRFEEWLSYLSEPQPHFPEDRVLEARALLVRVTRMMREVLAECQLEALSSEPPQWFGEFLSLVHTRRAIVITLNYDNLIECGVETFSLPLRPNAHVTEEDILRGLPAAANAIEMAQSDFVHFSAPSAYTMSRDPSATFELLKLHGSLSWYWSSGDQTGLSIQRWNLPGKFNVLYGEDVEARNRYLFGREPYVVPPAATKSSYLSDPLIRELWRRAARALASASRIVLVGYSVPQADQSLGGMIAEAIRGRQVELEVVDLKPRGPVARLRRLGGSDRKIASTSGDIAVGQWTALERDRVSSTLIERLRSGGELMGTELLYVAQPMTSEIVEVIREDEDAVIVPRVSGAASRSINTQALLDRLPGAKRLVVQDGDARVPILDVTIARQPNKPAGNFDIVELIPALPKRWS
jgi:hypothetical protein